jgi:hypothetical protein
MRGTYDTHFIPLDLTTPARGQQMLHQFTSQATVPLTSMSCTREATPTHAPATAHTSQLNQHTTR